MIKHKLCPDGSFVCGDTTTGVTAYAYPSSPLAGRVIRKPGEALGIATQRMSEENRYSSWREDNKFDTDNWVRLGGRS